MRPTPYFPSLKIYVLHFLIPRWHKGLPWTKRQYGNIPRNSTLELQLLEPVDNVKIHLELHAAQGNRFQLTSWFSLDHIARRALHSWFLGTHSQDARSKSVRTQSQRKRSWAWWKLLPDQEWFSCKGSSLWCACSPKWCFLARLRQQISFYFQATTSAHVWGNLDFQCISTLHYNPLQFKM